MIQAININQFGNNKVLKNPANFSAPAATNIQLPTDKKNYTVFNQEKVDYYVAQKEQALPHLKQVLQTSKDEKEIVEALYIVDRLIDNNTKGIPAMYPILAKYNDTESPNVQTFLAGIYRKTQVPDAFGPLVKMLIQNSIKNPSPPTPLTRFTAPTGSLASTQLSGSLCLPQGARVVSSPLTPNSSPFDPNEEIGGAILEYMRNYSNNPKKIDYSA